MTKISQLTIQCPFCKEQVGVFTIEAQAFTCDCGAQVDILCEERAVKILWIPDKNTELEMNPLLYL